MCAHHNLVHKKGGFNRNRIDIFVHLAHTFFCFFCITDPRRIRISLPIRNTRIKNDLHFDLCVSKEVEEKTSENAFYLSIFSIDSLHLIEMNAPLLIDFPSISFNSLRYQRQFDLRKEASHKKGTTATTTTSFNQWRNNKQRIVNKCNFKMSIAREMVQQAARKARRSLK